MADGGVARRGHRATGAIVRWLTGPRAVGAALLAFSTTSLIAWAFYRRGWHNARIFTDPRWRRWMFAAWGALELYVAIADGSPFYAAAAGFFGVMFAADTWTIRQ